MYLIDIHHDFDFELEKRQEEIQNKLIFKRSKYMCKFVWRNTKIVFHTNQGRNSYLTWSKKNDTSKIQYQFMIKNVVKFCWEEKADTVYYQPYSSSSKQYIKYWLLHTFLPLHSILENKYEMLHVGSVMLNNKAILFAAPSFGGKSTLTHYFLTKGHMLLSDDKLACMRKNDEYYALPSYPYARNYRALEDLGEYVENFCLKSLPIGSVYALKMLEKDEDIYIRSIHGVEKFSIMEMCNDMKLSILKLEKFYTIYDMTQSLNIYEIGIPKNIERLEEVYAAIVLHNVE